MKNELDNNETFLADWLAGKIPDEDLKQRVSATDFEAYRQLRDSLSELKIADPDIEKNFAATQEKFRRKEKVKIVRTLPLYRYAAVAAMLVVLFGLYQLFIFSNTIETGFGELSEVHLNDGSEVTLNARSKLSFPSLFRYNRTLKLAGEACFDVKKGRPFTVETPQGNVSVLGTRFNVISRSDFFEIICFEGKVQVNNDKESVVLTKGNAVRFYHGKVEKWDTTQQNLPLWMSGESGFRNTPLEFVIGNLENQYNYSIEYPTALGQTRFTGTFTHSDITTALKSVCIPLNLKYTVTDNRKIVISE
ncbi:MAG TPA: FecR domain-containing protein [Flavobacterium sp.]|jgi:ferric-dicitrate binding protein FerR (iron transport regulator)